MDGSLMVNHRGFLSALMISVYWF